MPMELSIVPLQSLGQDPWNSVQHYFFIIWFCWHQHQHHLSQCHHQWHHCICLGKIIKMSYNMTNFGHVIQLALASESHDAYSIINQTIAFLNNMRCNWNEMQQDFWPLDATGIKSEITWCHLHWYLCHMMLMPSSVAPLHSLGQYNQYEVPHGFFGHVMPLALVSHHAIGISISIMWCYWHQWQDCMMPVAMVLVSHDVTGVSIAWHHWHVCHIMPTASSMTPLYSLGQKD